MLAERVEALLSQEHVKWTSGRQQVLQADQADTGQAAKR
jgi:hypothetical protein